MGLFDFLRRLFISPPQQTSSAAHASRRSRRRRGRVQLVPLRRGRRDRQKSDNIEEQTLPYRFAQYGLRRGRFLNLCQDGDDNLLARFGLPVFHTPEQLADWLHMPLGEVAWLTHRFSEGYRPENQQRAHYWRANLRLVLILLSVWFGRNESARESKIDYFPNQ